jgi:hypothetical protein
MPELSPQQNASFGALIVEVVMDVLSGDKVARIRELNDAFRTSFRGGKILLTQSVADLPEMVKTAALQKVAEYTDFNEKNDPCEEHDFLSFELCNRTFIFSIVYYDKKLEHASPDPTDPAVTERIGTLMMSSDW